MTDATDTMTAPTQDLEDLIREALEDSMDADWTPSVGARYVLRALAREHVRAQFAASLAEGQG